MKEPKCHRCVELQRDEQDRALVRDVVIKELTDYLYAVNGWSSHVEALLARLQ